MLSRRRERYRDAGGQHAAVPAHREAQYDYDPSCRGLLDGPAAVLVCSDPLVGEAVRFIAEHCREALQVDDVAEHLHVSRSTLIRRFKAELGRSVLSEIDRQRIAELKRLLMRSGRSIAEIGDLCGFSGSSQFSRYFKRETGVTPSAYRRGQRVPAGAVVYGSG